MLKTVEISRAKKTKGIAVTYRAGGGEKYGTCPTSCKMNASGKGSEKIDQDYLNALLDAKPRLGESFTYSHFDPNLWADKLSDDKTVINYSTENKREALAVIKSKTAPVVLVMPENHWMKRGHITLSNGKDFSLKVVRCPAEYNDKIGCNNCGNGSPLCARLKRNFIVGFTAHGPSKRLAADNTKRGGCYADAGNCRIWWKETAESEQPDETDGEKLLRFAASLPPRAIIRHHVAGDIGAE